MKVCFVVTEYFGWGKFGGFGRASRTIASELAKRGIDIHVLTHKSEQDMQPSYCFEDGVHIHAFRRKPLLSHFGLDLAVSRLAHRINADIYHSQAVSLWTLHAQVALPYRKHVITFQDPELATTWEKWRSSPYYFVHTHTTQRIRKTTSRIMRKLFYNNMKRRAVKNADFVCSQTKYHIPEIMRLYGLNQEPTHLPNPIKIPTKKLRKADMPTVLFLARWDVVKRPWVFFKIAEAMPNVSFICTGEAKDKMLDQKLRRYASKIPNLNCPGHIDPKQVLEDSWILINCSIKEALPVSFLEACAYKCAIVSCNNPDGFASKFGTYIQNGENVDEYVDALRSLISNEKKVKALGQSAYDYVKETHELNTVIDKHLEIYRRLLN